ncbi:MAG: hypothetical protein LC772_08765 [Chloroflexi bacterium]|nr:hypothetical protein [Chloroflexota bacterium]
MKHRPLVTLLILALIGGAIAALVILPTQLGLDLVGGVRGVFLATSQPASPGARERAASPAEMDTAISVIEKRVNKLGVSEAQVQKKGADQIIVEIPLTQSARARHMTATGALKALNNVVQPAFLQFVEFPDSVTVRAERKNAQGEETFIYVGPTGPLTEAQALAQAKVILSGKDLLPDAAAEFDPTEGYAVSLHFDDRGAQIFDDYTRTHIGKFFGVPSAPVCGLELPG